MKTPPPKTQQQQPSGEMVAPVDATGLRRRQPREFDEVDARIQLPLSLPPRQTPTLATQFKMKMNRKMNAPGDDDGARVLQTGISQYRSLQQRSAASPRGGRDRGESAADRGLALVGQKQFAAAIPYFTEALNASPSSSSSSSAPSPSSSAVGMQSKVRLYYQRGNCYLAAQKYKLAIEDFCQVMNMTPKNAQLFAKRGRAYAAMGENHAALLDFNEAINLTASQGLLSDDYHGTSVMVVGSASSSSSSPFPSLSSSSSYTGGSDTVTQLRALYVARAKVYRAMNQLTNALDDLARAEKHNGRRDAELYHLRAHVFLQCRQEQPALNDLDRFLELQEEHEMQMESTSLLGSNSSTDGSDTRRRIVEVLMERAKIVQRLATEEDAQERKDAEIHQVEQGRPLQGQALLEKALALATISPSSKPASPSKRKHSVCGKRPQGPTPYKGVQAKRLVKQAIHDYSRVLEMDPEHVEALRRRGEAFGHIEQYDEALEDFATALDTEPNDFEVHMARAKLYQQRGDVGRAIEEVTAVLRVNGFFVDALFYRARLFEEIGKLEQAKTDYTSIIDAHYDCRGEIPLSGAVETTVLATLSPNNAGQRNGISTPRIPNASKATQARSGTPAASSSTSGGTLSASTAIGPPVVKTGKMISEVAADALLCRARILEQCEDFDAAMADYQQILDSPSKNSKRLDAQLELQSAVEKKKLFEERRQREAVAWLEQKVVEEEGWEDVAKTGSAPGSGSASANGASTSKSKKKRKKKNKKKKAAGYVLLEDDEDLEIVIEAPNRDADKSTSRRDGGDEEAHASGGDSNKGDSISASSTPKAAEKESVSFTESVVDESAVVAEAPTPLPEDSRDEKRSPVAKAVMMTRDEAFDSMWEENDEAGDIPDASTVADNGDRSESADDDDPGSEDKDVGQEEDSSFLVKETKSEEEVEEEDGEDTAGSTTDSTSNDKVTVREVLMDERYLKKRQRQLEKLRASLLEFTESRDKAAIREVLERVERKKMADALAEEVAQANEVLLATEKQPEIKLEGSDHPQRLRPTKALSVASSPDRSSEKSDGTEEETARVDDSDAATAATVIPEEPSPASSFSSSAFKLHVVSPSNRARENEAFTSSGSSSTAASMTVTATSVSTTASSTSTTIASASGKPPALVIRPIAYNHALQKAEQNQHDMLQHQRLVQEKDAEIAYLKQLLAQSRQTETFAHLDHLDEQESGFQSRLLQLRSRFPHQRVAPMKRAVDELVDWMGPTGDADYVRQKVLTFVQRVLEAQFPPGTPIMFYPTGSFPMKTYLPTSDVDICLLLPKELEPTWYFAVMHALCLAGNNDVGVNVAGAAAAVNANVGVMNGSPPTSKLASGGAAAAAALSVGGAPAVAVPTTAPLLTNTVRNVSFINADVRVIKCTIDNVAVDLTANRVAALGAVMLLDEMDVRVAKGHLLKRSLIAIKAWCVHESAAYASASAPAGSVGTSTTTHQSVMGASHGAFSTYAVNTIVMALFNQYGDTITHPLQALFLFLDRMAEFPWHEAAMTLYGAVPLSVLATTPLGPVNGTGTAAQLKKSRAKSYTFGEAVAGSTKTDATGGKRFGEVMEADEIAGIRVSLLEQFAAFDASLTGEGDGYKPMFPVRVCNIVDPLDEKNNLARSVSADWFPMMKRAFRLGRNRLASMLLSTSSSSSVDKGVANDSVADFYAHSWKLYGRGDGWRPDLLVHPRQTWHGKATLNSLDARSAKARDEMRWESLLPAPPLAAGLVPAMYPIHYQQQLHHSQQLHHQHQQAMHHAHHHSPQPFYSPHPHQRVATSPITIGAGTAANGVAVGPGGNAYFPQHQQQRRPFASGGGSNGGAKSSPQRSAGDAASAAHPGAASLPKSSRRYDSPPPYAVHYSSK